MRWDEITRRFAEGISSTYEATLRRLGAAIEAGPDAFRGKVSAFLALLTEARANLERARAHLPHPPQSTAEAALVARYADMRSLYEALVLGLSQNATRTPELGLAPAVVLVVGSVGLSVAGVAWAVAAFEYAAALRDQTGFLAQELEARVQGMKQGVALPPSTVSPPAPPALPGGRGGGTGTAWTWLLGLGAAAAVAAFIVPKLGKG